MRATEMGGCSTTGAHKSRRKTRRQSEEIDFLCGPRRPGEFTSIVCAHVLIHICFRISFTHFALSGPALRRLMLALFCMVNMFNADSPQPHFGCVTTVCPNGNGKSEPPNITTIVDRSFFSLAGPRSAYSFFISARIRNERLVSLLPPNKRE